MKNKITKITKSNIYDNYLKKYERDGYIVLKKAIVKKQCKNLLKQTIIPILHRNNIYLSKEESWKNQPGEVIHNDGDHIISRDDKHFRFPALFNSKNLNSLLNKIHSRNKKKWKFIHLAGEGLGWIHLRYPYYKYKNKDINNVVCQYDSFHLDGITDNNYINPHYSAVLLPFITTVYKNCGGTAVIPSSHKLINDYLLRYNYNSNNNINDKINSIVDNNNDKIIDIIGEQGDILIMHPLLIHSPSLADSNARVRIMFNLATEKL